MNEKPITKKTWIALAVSKILSYAPLLTFLLLVIATAILVHMGIGMYRDNIDDVEALVENGSLPDPLLGIIKGIVTMVAGSLIFSAMAFLKSRRRR